jgi:predicted transcriptional regulator
MNLSFSNANKMYLINKESDYYLGCCLRKLQIFGMIYLQEFSSFEPQKILNIISVLTDNTRLEILSLLIQNNEGLTAADISRRIDKKIPSTIYQLEIIQASGLITSDMKEVKSIGRSIKHWILPQENYHFLFTVDLNVLINESNLSMEIRESYLTLLQNYKKIIGLNELSSFDPEILKNVILSNGSKLDDKEITKIVQLKPERLLVDTFIHRIRKILENSNVNEGYHRVIFGQMLGITDEVLNKMLNEIINYFDIGFDFESEIIYRKV